MRTRYQTALLLALLVKRSGERRVRVSAKTFKMLSGRKQLRSSFVVDVSEHLQGDFGVYLTELDTGGYGLIYAKSLEAAKAALGTKLLTQEELSLLKRREDLNWTGLEEELTDLDDEEEDNDE